MGIEPTTFGLDLPLICPTSSSVGRVTVDLIRRSWVRGKDGLVSSVSLRVSSGTELLRPIEKLYPLEVSSENNAQDTEKEEKEALADKQRPQVRLAAQKAIHSRFIESGNNHT